MNKILWQIYNGEICMTEQYRPVLDEYKAMREKHLENYKDFLAKLDSPLDEEFIKIIDEQFDELPFDFFQMFSDGFRLGVKMMIEVLGNEDNEKTD